MTITSSSVSPSDSALMHAEGLRHVIEERSLVRPGSINNRLAPEFVSCSEDGKTCTIRYLLRPEMSNPMGWLHGGMTSTMIDMGMGTLAYYHKQALCPTSSMTINYLRPNRIGGYLMVQSTIHFLGSKIIHLSSQTWMEDEPDKLTATATGVFSVLGSSSAEPLSEKVGRLH